MKRSSVKTAIVAPLDWGLGHATRCIPIIESLLDEKYNVVICGSGGGLALLRNRFPHCICISSKPYRFFYPSRGNMSLSMLFSAPFILADIYKEMKEAARIVDQYHPELIISDNRYGFYSPRVHSIFITHQLFIKAPFLAGWIHSLTHKFIKKFNECWIPDFEGENTLSGSLSHLREVADSKFIGPLSRFKGRITSSGKKLDFIAVISGPEPQRSILEKMLIDQALLSEFSGIIVQGKPEEDQKIRLNERVNLVSHLSDEELIRYISSASFFVGRSGYSTIMDLCHFDISPVFIPTPGQTEQEYLAEYHQERGSCSAYKQDRFNLKTALAASASKGFLKFNDESSRLTRILQQINLNPEI